MSACRADGVEVAESRSGRLVHLGPLPDGVDPDHEVVLAELDDLVSAERARTDLHQLAQELVAHHTVMHPVSDCPFSTRLLEALRSRR